MRYTPHLIRTPKALELDTAADLFAPPVLWAIPHLLPCHRLSLIVAPSGTGLTHLACRLAASVAQPDIRFGPAVPDASPLPPCLPDPSSPPGPANQPIDPPPPPPPSDQPILPTTLLISFRDHPDVLRPRLLAAGANPQQVLVLSQVHDQTDDHHKAAFTRPFRPDDLALLDELLHENRSIRLILFDSAHLLFNSSNRPSRAKLERQLQAFADLAQARECAIVFLTTIPHLCANPFRSTILAALHEACRLVYLLAPDPDDPNHRYLLRLKHTLAEPTLSLHLHPAPMSSSRGAALQAATAKSLPAPESSSTSDPAPYYGIINNHYSSPSLLRLHATPTDLTYQTYLEQRHAPKQRGPIPHARLMAQAFLEKLLSPGQPLPVGHEHHPEPDSLRAQARAAGLAWGTVRRAMNHLPIQALHKDNRWFWHLPTPSILNSPTPELLPEQPPTCAPPPETCASCVPASVGQACSLPPQDPRVPEHIPDPEAAPVPLKHQVPSTKHPSAPSPETCAPCPLPSSIFPLPSSSPHELAA